MNKIPPAALTNEIARSAAAQMAEYGHAEKTKRRKAVPASTVNKIVKNIILGAGGFYCGVDLSASDDMTADVVIKGK